jgi:hypothetical protein
MGVFMEYARLTPGSGFNPIHSLLYYGQRVVTSPSLRRLIVATLRHRIHARHGAFPAGTMQATPEPETLDALHNDGYAPLPALLSADQIADIRAFFRSKLLASRQDIGSRFTIDNVPQGVRIADYSLNDMIDSPHILELANRPSLLRLAASYIGCKPTISALGLRWSFPATGASTDVQAFHRDTDDWRYLKILVYLTNVSEEAGPHVYVRGSHLTRAPMRLRPYQDTEISRQYGADRTIVATGQAGFGFAVDTAGIHKGAVPATEPRLMLQIQYSLLPAFAYRYQPQPYNGPLVLDSYINRLFCAPAD